ncbi:MAG: hypothetical protein JWP37_1587 [Mucilaginibacter sp.]|nr:hypothetical protein [Mucilaginibacter sp.]
MQRRKFIKSAIGLGLIMHPFVKAWSKPLNFRDLKLSGPPKPIFIYNNWSAYDELSDNVPQTEELAMRELNEVIRLKSKGVEIDYYVMDAFWFDLWGGYRTWHKQHWPNGPDKWLIECKRNNIKPGMWFSTNLIATHSGRFLEVISEWKDSLGTDPNIMCMFDGGYLKHLSDTLQLWYDKGVRLFKFDFAYFEAVTPAMKDKYTKEQVLEKNKIAFMDMLQQFRKKNPDVLITGYNGFGGNMENTYTPFNEKIDPRWLDTFDTLYCGDPRFSDVPMMNIWRSQDNYSDHQVSAYQAYGMPIRRIDNCAFMIGKTGTCYYRANNCWKGMLILELARGGWVNVYHGNLELLNNEDAKWFAKVQNMYHPLQVQDCTVTFGGVPGKGKPYGFKSSTVKGAVCTVVNPSQAIVTMDLPVTTFNKTKLLYADGGYKPTVNGNKLTIGPEQLVVVGFDVYAGGKYDLGVDKTIRIPIAIDRIESTFTRTGKNTIEGEINVLKGKNVRIIMQQFDAKGVPYRSWPGSPPDGKKVSEAININALQDGKNILLHIEYDKVIWSGLSWAAAEIKHGDFDQGKPLHIKCTSGEKDELKLSANIYSVSYQ